MGITEALARKIVETTYESLPERVIQVAREIVLDGVSNMLAGSQEPLGRWDNPLPWEDRLAKFYDCARRVLAPAEAQRVASLVERFETLESLRPLMDLLRVPTAKV